MNKMFTAVATLQLVQANKLGLNDALGKCLTDYPNKEVAAVTIHELLTHTGGTGDIFGPEFDAHRLELHTLQDYLKLYGGRGVKYDPGSTWEYSNYGFILLGMVIEKVSGESYYDYIREHIYTPAGMASSGSEPEDQAELIAVSDTRKWAGIVSGNPIRIPCHIVAPRREAVTPQQKIYWGLRMRYRRTSCSMRITPRC